MTPLNKSIVTKASVGASLSLGFILLALSHFSGLVDVWMFEATGFIEPITAQLPTIFSILYYCSLLLGGGFLLLCFLNIMSLMSLQEILDQLKEFKQGVEDSSKSQEERELLISRALAYCRGKVFIFVKDNQHIPQLQSDQDIVEAPSSKFELKIKAATDPCEIRQDNRSSLDFELLKDSAHCFIRSFLSTLLFAAPLFVLICLSPSRYFFELILIWFSVASVVFYGFYKKLRAIGQNFQDFKKAAVTYLESKENLSIAFQSERGFELHLPSSPDQKPPAMTTFCFSLLHLIVTFTTKKQLTGKELQSRRDLISYPLMMLAVFTATIVFERFDHKPVPLKKQDIQIVLNEMEKNIVDKNKGFNEIEVQLYKSLTSFKPFLIKYQPISFSKVRQDSVKCQREKGYIDLESFYASKGSEGQDPGVLKDFNLYPTVVICVHPKLINNKQFIEKLSKLAKKP